jgi:hypothetical protein
MGRLLPVEPAAVADMAGIWRMAAAAGDLLAGEDMLGPCAGKEEGEHYAGVKAAEGEHGGQIGPHFQTAHHGTYQPRAVKSKAWTAALKVAHSLS